MKKFLAMILGAALMGGALTLPTGDQLELYDVSNVVYMMDNSAITIDVNPTPVELDLEITGMELADQLGWLVPGSDRFVEFSNDLIIVRATVIQHAAVRAAIAARRLRNQTCQSLAVGFYHVKTALSKLFRPQGSALKA